MGGHPIYFIWDNTAPFCFLILRSDRISLHYTSIYSCITIVYLLPHAYKPNKMRSYDLPHVLYNISAPGATPQDINYLHRPNVFITQYTRIMVRCRTYAG
jgi:hypothetical protein